MCAIEFVCFRASVCVFLCATATTQIFRQDMETMLSWCSLSEMVGANAVSDSWHQKALFGPSILASGSVFAVAFSFVWLRQCAFEAGCMR
jgi:hypothetical protein